MALMNFVLWLLVSAAAAQKGCPAKFTSKTGDPNMSNGFTARVIGNGFNNPRSLLFDSAGHLLVVEKGRGITAVTLDGGDCVNIVGRTSVVADSTLSHSIQLTHDEKRLFASTSSNVYSWEYDASSAKTTSKASTWVTGMYNTDHTTRTLLISKKVPDMMLVSRGSASNIDNQAHDKNSGHSNIRAFNISGSPRSTPYTGGTLVGWGLRNSVGLAEHPIDGGIWSNENGSDDLRRDGKDIHENSPGEEINFHGYLNGTKYAGFGANYGYPDCGSPWHIEEMPRNRELKIGKQFYIGGAATAMDDNTCDKQYMPPRLTLPSHWAPIDIKFNSKGTVAYMTSRGSWNKRSPDGYALFAISFGPDGQPIHPPSSTTAARPVLATKNLSLCGPMSRSCIRPTGLAFDAKGRLYMAAEVTGEIFVIERNDGRSVDSVTLESSPP